MIAFLTFFLGLVAGSQKVEFSVTGPVAAIEVSLDGSTVARLEHSPWAASVDLGQDLSPHELVARALDEGGEEIGRVHQWLNLPRPPAEVEVLLERGPAGQATAASVSSESLLGSEPTKLSATFDGVSVAPGPGRRFIIPPYDPRGTHLLAVAAEFPNRIEARRDLVLGGGAESQAAAELTSVPVRITGPAPTARAVSGWFVNGQGSVPVVAVEHGAAQVLIVRDLSSAEATARLGGGNLRIRPLSNGEPYLDPGPLKRDLRLGHQDIFRFLWPVARVSWGEGLRTELFETSHDFPAGDVGLSWLLTHVDDPAPAVTPPRFADAVAIAGLQAASTRGRRAVILILGQGDVDASRTSPPVVRRYLEKLRVPLYVWSLAGSSGGRDSWGDREDISAPSRLRSAFARLKKDLQAQWIVWVAGEHRPQDIALSGQARGLELVH